VGDRYALTKENKGAVDAALDFPRLKLKKNEVARVAIIGLTTADGKPKLATPEPEGGYFFDLRVPGNDREFRGSFECLAAPEKLDRGELDPSACPHCAVVKRGVSEAVVGPVKRRFVLPIVRYKTKPGSVDVIQPPSIEVVSWRFTDRYFNELVDVEEQWGESGGMLAHDLSLTCEIEQYQTYRVAVLPKALWREDRDGVGKLVLGTLMAVLKTVPGGLRRQCGTTLNAIDLKARLDEVLKLAEDSRGTSDTLPEVDAASIAGLADDLFGSGKVAPEADASFMGADAPEEGAAPAPVAGESFDFDSFFKG
jgi:hypothetical protein